MIYFEKLRFQNSVCNKSNWKKSHQKQNERIVWGHIHILHPQKLIWLCKFSLVNFKIAIRIWSRLAETYLNADYINTFDLQNITVESFSTEIVDYIV